MPKIICSSSESGPTRFKFWDALKTEEERDYLIKLMRKKGNTDWQPDEVIEVESSQEAARIMQEPPKGRQAIITGGK